MRIACIAALAAVLSIAAPTDSMDDSFKECIRGDVVSEPIHFDVALIDNEVLHVPEPMTREQGQSTPLVDLYSSPPPGRIWKHAYDDG